MPLLGAPGVVRTQRGPRARLAEEDELARARGLPELFKHVEVVVTRAEQKSVSVSGAA